MKALPATWGCIPLGWPEPALANAEHTILSDNSRDEKMNQAVIVELDLVCLGHVFDVPERMLMQAQESGFLWHLDLQVGLLAF